MNKNSAVDTAQQANAFFNNATTTRNNTNNNLTLFDENNHSSSTPPPPPLPPTAQQHETIHNNLSPILIAVIIIIPVLAAVVSILYFRKSIFNRSNSLNHQNNPRSLNSTQSTPIQLIIPPGGTGADRPIGQRRTDRFRRRIIGAIHRSGSRSESVRTVPEYSADPQEAEISLAHSQRSAAPQEPNLMTRFMTQTHLTNGSSRAQYNLPPIPLSGSLFSPELDHPLNAQNNTSYHTNEPPPDYDVSTSNYPTQSSSSSSVLPDPIQIVIPSPNQPSTHHSDHHQNLQIHRTLTSNSDASSITSPRNSKPTDPTHRIPTFMMHTELFRGSSDSSLLPPPPPLTTTSSSTNNHHHNQNENGRTSTTNTAMAPGTGTSTEETNTQQPQASHQVYYRIPSAGPTPQQLSFLTRIGHLSRLGLPRPPPLSTLPISSSDVNHELLPPPPFDSSSSLPPPPF